MFNINPIKPSKEKWNDGYVRSNWGWRPLWEWVRQAAPDIAERVKYYATNNGDGLVETPTLELAYALSRAIENNSPDPATFAHNYDDEPEYPRPTREHIEEFIDFLEHSGGFTID